MKVALCLYGTIGSSKGKSHRKNSTDVLYLGYEKYYENIIKDNDVDVFMHSWSHKNKKEIIKLYRPVKSLIEEQESFLIPSEIKGNTPAEPRRVEFVFSRWRSTQKALDLKIAYEKENNFQYDACLVSRFDIAFETKVNFSEIDLSKINFSNWYGVTYDQVIDIFKDGRGIFYRLSEKHDTDGLPRFNRGFPYDSEGLLDYWFISDNKINVFSQLYDRLPEYFKSGKCPGAPLVSNHKVMLYHLQQTNNANKINLIMEPTKDHAMIRWKYFNSKE